MSGNEGATGASLEARPAQRREGGRVPIGEGDAGGVVMRTRPRSAAAEQYRVLAQRAERWLVEELRLVAITSSVSGEGRTTTAVNLALALAARRRSVLLVDAQLRGPGVARALGLPRAAGLAELLDGKIALEQAVQRVGGDPDKAVATVVADPRGDGEGGKRRAGDGVLDVLPAGVTDEPHRLHADPRLSAVLAELRRRYDAVIVDAPPILPTADLIGLVPEVDGLVVVCLAGHTRRELLATALEAIPDARVLGAVLHRVDAGVGESWPLYARHDRAQRAPASSAAGSGR